MIASYVAIARPDHWIKNIFMLPGVALALFFVTPDFGAAALHVAIAMAALCLAASANYTINEFLDAEFDKFHPKKKERSGAKGLLDGRIVAVQYAALLISSLALGLALDVRF